MGAFRERFSQNINVCNNTKLIFENILVGDRLNVEYQERIGIFKSNSPRIKYENRKVIYKNDYYFQIKNLKENYRISVLFADLVSDNCRISNCND
jgi:hypothetical protein